MDFQENLKRETQQRLNDDLHLQDQIDESFLELNQEFWARSKSETLIRKDISNLQSQSSKQKSQIDLETQSRIQDTSQLQRQTDLNAHANIQNTLNLLEINSRLKNDLADEEAQRKIQGEFLKTQSDTN